MSSEVVFSILAVVFSLKARTISREEIIPAASPSWSTTTMQEILSQSRFQQAETTGCTPTIKLVLIAAFRLISICSILFFTLATNSLGENGFIK